MADKKTAAEPKAKSCFMITPIGQAGSQIRRHADWVFKFAVEPVAKEMGYVATRADLIADPLMINDSVFQAIMEADVCIADLSFLNPNVFYELGVRHALVKPVIHIAHEETALPFDNAGYRTIMFDLGEHGSMVLLREAISNQIATIEQDGFKLSNPLTHAKGRLALADSGDSKDRIISDLERRLARLEGSQRPDISLGTWRPDKYLHAEDAASYESTIINLEQAYHASVSLEGIFDLENFTYAVNALVPSRAVTREQIRVAGERAGASPAHIEGMQHVLIRQGRVRP
jgi:nucleoside 2-deoxyribosyltransferase